MLKCKPIISCCIPWCESLQSKSSSHAWQLVLICLRPPHLWAKSSHFKFVILFWEPKTKLWFFLFLFLNRWCPVLRVMGRLTESSDLIVLFIHLRLMLACKLYYHPCCSKISISEFWPHRVAHAGLLGHSIWISGKSLLNFFSTAVLGPMPSDGQCKLL